MLSLCLSEKNFNFQIEFYTMQSWTVTTGHDVPRKRRRKRWKKGTWKLFRKSQRKKCIYIFERLRS